MSVMHLLCGATVTRRLHSGQMASATSLPSTCYPCSHRSPGSSGWVSICSLSSASTSPVLGLKAFTTPSALQCGLRELLPSGASYSASVVCSACPDVSCYLLLGSLPHPPCVSSDTALRFCLAFQTSSLCFLWDELLSFPGSKDNQSALSI